MHSGGTWEWSRVQCGGRGGSGGGDEGGDDTLASSCPKEVLRGATSMWTCDNLRTVLR